MIRAAVIAAFLIVTLLIARPYSAAGQTIPPRPGCGCEVSNVAEPPPLPLYFLPFISR
jgi:hypothetical protein